MDDSRDNLLGNNPQVDYLEAPVVDQQDMVGGGNTETIDPATKPIEVSQQVAAAAGIMPHEEDSDTERAIRVREGHEAFQKLLENPERLKELVEGSFFSEEGTTPDELYALWTKNRESVIKAIDTDGTILDYGCANGFFLRCVQEWSGRDLDVYGIDSIETKVVEARELFSDIKDHFISTEEDAENRDNFPQEFDYVYWNAWDRLIENGGITESEYFKPLLDRVRQGGKFILGLYHKDPQQNRKIVEELKESGLSIEIIDSEKGQAFIVIRKANET